MDKKSRSKQGPKNNDSLFRKICKNMKLVKLKSPAVAAPLPAHEEKDVPIEKEVPITEIPSTDKEECFNDFQYEWQSRRMTTQDLESFVDHLSKFNQYVQSIRELQSMAYRYPHALQNKLEQNSNELECFYGEVRAALENIRRMQIQRKAVKKETEAAKVTLKKIKEDEAREMESMLHAYDKVMFSRWENLKITHKPELLESFLTDAKNRQKAMESLQSLIARRLATLTILTPICDKMATATCSAAVAAGGPARHHLTASPADATAITPSSVHRPFSRRHRHLDNGNVLSSVARVPTLFGGPPIRYPDPVVSGYHMAQSTAQQSTAQQSTAHQSIVLTSTSSTTLVNTSPHQSMQRTTNRRHDQANALRNAHAERIARHATNTTTAGAEFASEMQSVLRALYGELRSSATDVTESPDPFLAAATSDTTDIDPLDFELYTVD